MVWRSLFFAVLLFYLPACNNQQKPEKASEVEEEGIVTRDGIEISYRGCGNKDTSLLFIHGWGINKEYWEPQIEHFCNRYNVVAIDLPGFGKSGKNRTYWSFDEYAADVKGVIDQLNLRNVILVGHSMSGDIVLNVANKYPSAVIGLVGIDNLHEPGSPMNEQQQMETNAFFTQISSHFDSTAKGYMKGMLFQPTTDSAIVNRVMNDVLNSDSTIAIKVLHSMTVIAQKEQELMKGLPARLYLINSDVNPTKLDSLNKYCRYGCELVPVYATGHYPMLEKPTEFIAAMEKVIAMISNRKRE